MRAPRIPHPLHKVLSFVRRSGRLDDRLQRAWDNYADTYLLDITTGNLLDVREGVTLNRNFVAQHWGNDNPLIVEIGTGQGENVVRRSGGPPRNELPGARSLRPRRGPHVAAGGQARAAQHPSGTGQRA